MSQMITHPEAPSVALQTFALIRDQKNCHLVRLHIGLEDTKDLIDDLKSSLKFIK